MFAYVMMVVVSAFQGDSVFCYHAFISGRFGFRVTFSRPCCAAERLSASSGDSNVIQAVTNTFLLNANCSDQQQREFSLKCGDALQPRRSRNCGYLPEEGLGVWSQFLFGCIEKLSGATELEQKPKWMCEDIGVQGFHSSISFSFSLMNGEFLIKV